MLKTAFALALKRHWALLGVTPLITAASDWRHQPRNGVEMNKPSLDYAFSTLLKLIRAALLMATVFSCAYTQAMCIAPFVPKGADPVKARIKYAVDRSEAVFTGYVSALEYVPAITERGNGEMLVVRMTVRAQWKGARTDEITLNTSTYRYPDGITSSEAHGYNFELGETYLVYASAFNGGLSSSICTRTKPIGEAAQDTEVLSAEADRISDGRDWL